MKLAHQAIVSSIVDAAVTQCGLENWQGWTSFALSATQRWPKERPDAIFEFRQLTIGAIWPPGFEEFRRATTTFSILIHRATQTFMENSDLQGDTYFADAFYRRTRNDKDHDAQLKKFEEWQDRCYSLLKEATKAANWFADVVRRDINPMFFATKGKFLIMEGPFMDLSFRTSLLEYTVEEKAKLPDALNAV